VLPRVHNSWSKNVQIGGERESTTFFSKQASYPPGVIGSLPGGGFGICICKAVRVLSGSEENNEVEVYVESNW